MSTAEFERFASDLRSNEALRVEAEKAAAAASNGMAALAAFAMSKGYGVTLEQLRERMKVAAAATGKVLSDAELDGVAAAGIQSSTGNIGFLTGNNIAIPIIVGPSLP